MTGRPRTRDHLEERASEKITEANELLAAGRPVPADRVAWEAAYLLSRAKSA